MAAAQLVLEENMFVKEVVRELSIHSNTLYRWISEYEEYGESAFPGLLEEKECVRFQYLKENKHKYNIKKACKTLNISRSGY
ncbi:transposase [Bacillus toyonensis]